MPAMPTRIGLAADMNEMEKKKQMRRMEFFIFLRKRIGCKLMDFARDMVRASGLKYYPLKYWFWSALSSDSFGAELC